MSETITLDILYANTLLGVSNFTKNNVLLSFEVEIIHSLVPQSLKQSVFFSSDLFVFIFLSVWITTIWIYFEECLQNDSKII